MSKGPYKPRKGRPGNSLQRSRTPIAQQIIKLRLNRGLTQRELAEMAGVPQSRVSEYESGRRLRPRGKHFHAILEVLGLNDKYSSETARD